MKHVLTVVTFVIGALCFAMFLITVKQDPLTAVPHRASPHTAKWRFLASRYAVPNPKGGSAESIVPDGSMLKPSMTMSTNEVNL
jgi:hypothetical protein